MTAPKWQAGKLYVPGDIVQPVTAPKPTAAQVANGSFEDGATGWDFTAPVVLSTVGGYSGANNCRIPGGVPGEGLALNQTQLVVDPGKSLTARCMIHQGASDTDHTRGWVEVQWFDADGLWLKTDKGNVINDGRGGAWLQSSVTSARPANAAYARAGIGLYQNSGDEVNGDYLTVSGAQSALPEGLVYKAVQSEAGTSGASEPAWPSVLGVQVNDNEVIWEAVATNRVTWTAKPRYVSGDTEPAWPGQVGGFVQDGTINWKAISRRVEDENCPNSKVVAIIASKVFAADRDIVRFSATLNPLDWTTEQDAGFLATGLQQANSNNMAVLNQYRGNLVAFNASCFQNWQADPDPAAMALLDQMDGIGSTWQQAASPVGNELFYLSQLGVRTIGIANAAENLAAGDVGSPIDPLVREAIRVATANGSKVHSTYYPGAGQYWLAFPDYPPNPVAISGDLPDGDVGVPIEPFSYTASGGVLPLGSFSLVDPAAFPPGLSMDVNGNVTGTPTQGGTFAWTVQIADADGTVAMHEDSADVWVTQWLLTQSDTSVSKPYLDAVWIGEDVTDWTGSTLVRRDPFTDLGRSSYGGGYLQVADNVAIGAGLDGNIERAVGFGATDAVATTVETGAITGTPCRIRRFGDLVIITTSDEAFYYTSEDAGLTWTKRAAPSSRIYDIAKVGDRWVTEGSGVDGFFYSDDAVPETWASASSDDVSSNSQGAIASNGAAAVKIGSLGRVFRTTDGLSWAQTGAQVAATMMTAAAIDDYFVFAANSGTSACRSTDAGLTFTDFTLPFNTKRIDVIDGLVVFCTVGGGLYYSTDGGATLSPSAMPVAFDSSETFFAAKFRYLP